MFRTRSGPPSKTTEQNEGILRYLVKPRYDSGRTHPNFTRMRPLERRSAACGIGIHACLLKKTSQARIPIGQSTTRTHNQSLPRGIVELLRRSRPLWYI